ncbi:MAG: tetratricopeptide repeat protein, partial [Candidatus Thorarchaeota archaeon]
ISWIRGDLNHALEYIESCKIIANNLNLINILHRSDAQLGIIYSMKGDLDRALSYDEQVLAFAKKNNDLEIMSNIYNNIGQIYQEKGDLDRALEYLKKSIRIKEKYGPNLALFIVTDSLFHLALDMNDLGQAQRYLNRMKQINDQEMDQNIFINQGYNLDRAIYLKNSPLALNRGKAEELLKQLIEKGIHDYELLSTALLNLCDLLLYDLHMTNELEILDELQFYISQLFETIKKSRSFSLLAETYLLQARLTLLNLDLIRTQQFLTKAQEIAENYGLNRLAIKISNEHDELLKRLDMWDKLKTSKVSLSERLELVRPNEQMKRMIQKREIVVPEASDEKPVLLLIISEGGNPIFSQSFTKQQLFEDHLFGGFFFAINSFISEKFSKGLDRATFGEYTLLMKAISPFFVCYVFKGQSYLAQKRINFFIECLKENEDTWHTFRDFHYLNKEIQIKDIPSLEPMITKIFINKSVSLIV